MKKLRRGFTVIELLLGIAITVTLAVAAIAYMRGAIVSVSSDALARDLASAVRSAKGRAAAGDLGAAWGVRTVHGGASGVDRFELFATSTASDTPNFVGVLPDVDVHVLPAGASWGIPVDVGVQFFPARSTTTPVSFVIKNGGGVVQVNVSSSGDTSIQ